MTIYLNSDENNEKIAHDFGFWKIRWVLKMTGTKFLIWVVHFVTKLLKSFISTIYNHLNGFSWVMLADKLFFNFFWSKGIICHAYFCRVLDTTSCEILSFFPQNMAPLWNVFDVSRRILSPMVDRERASRKLVRRNCCLIHVYLCSGSVWCNYIYKHTFGSKSLII